MTDGLHVVAIGGAGAMGRHAVRVVARLEPVARVSIADIDLRRANRLAAELGPVGRALQLDATDPDALAAACRGGDVVLNTMGPFARFGLPILTAAIEARCDYLDIDDDWESTLDALELDNVARERGVRAVIGLGASPGVTNLLALEAARRLDAVDRMFTGWKLAATTVEHEPGDEQRAGASAALEHWLLQCSGRVKAWVDGAVEDVTPLQEVVVDFPGLGAQRTYSVGHPEPLTLPRTIRGIAHSCNVMSGPQWLFDSIRAIAAAYERDELSLADGARRLEEIERPARATTPRDPMPRLWALAQGGRDGREAVVSAHLSAWPPHRMGGMTGYPLAIGVDLLAAGLVGGPGVMTPEQAIEPHAFWERLTRLVDPPAPSADHLLVVRERVGAYA